MASFRLYQRPLFFARRFAAEQRQNPGTRIRRQLNIPGYLQQPVQTIASKEGRGGERSFGFGHPASSEKKKRTRYPLRIAVGLYSTLSLFWVLSWDEVPITGRWRLQCSPKKNPKLLADDPTDVFLGSGRLPSSNDNPPVLRLRQTRSVLDRLLAASGLSHQEWNLLIITITPDLSTLIVRVGASNSGQVVITTPMFTAVESDDEIAAILSHGITHSIAGHSREQTDRRSIGYMTLLPAIPCFASLASLPLAVPSLAMSAWLLLLPVAEQKYEAEADDIGLLLMAEAEFDPRVVPSVFERLNKLADRGSGANSSSADESGNDLTSEAWNSKHPHESPAISRIASKVWKSLYLTGKGPLHPDLTCGEIRDLEKSKQRWQNFLQQRPRPKSWK